MEQYPVPSNELERIRQLISYELLGVGKDPDVDVFAQAACLITDGHRFRIELLVKK